MMDHHVKKLTWELILKHLQLFQTLQEFLVNGLLYQFNRNLTAKSP